MKSTNEVWARKVLENDDVVKITDHTDNVTYGRIVNENEHTIFLTVSFTKSFIKKIEII